MKFRPTHHLLRRAALLVAIAAMATLTGAASGTPATADLRAAIEQWSDERDAWAFTQTVREFDGAHVQHVRVERFDPSRGDAHRWTLVSIDDRPPTAADLTSFARRKGSRRKQRSSRAPSDYVDYKRVTVLEESVDAVDYLVPLREDINRLVPIDQLAVIVTVDRHQPMVRKIIVTLVDPMKIAFGLAQVTDMNFDLSFEIVDDSKAPAPENVRPVGTAEAEMRKFGDRAEFSWSEFQRVAPATAEPKPQAEP